MLPSACTVQCRTSPSQRSRVRLACAPCQATARPSPSEPPRAAAPGPAPFHAGASLEFVSPRVRASPSLPRAAAPGPSASRAEASSKPELVPPRTTVPLQASTPTRTTSSAAPALGGSALQVVAPWPVSPCYCTFVILLPHLRHHLACSRSLNSRPLQPHAAAPRPSRRMPPPPICPLPPCLTDRLLISCTPRCRTAKPDLQYRRRELGGQKRGRKQSRE